MVYNFFLFIREIIDGIEKSWFELTNYLINESIKQGLIFLKMKKYMTKYQRKTVNKLIDKAIV